MKKIVFGILIAFCAIACNKLEDPRAGFGVQTLEVSYAGGDEITVELQSNRDWTLTTDGQDWYTVEPMSGSGNATLTFHVRALEEAATRAAVITVTAETEEATLSLVQGLPETANVKSGSFLIEEVFFAGFLPEGSDESDMADGDQYIKITNNTDNLLYADGLSICFTTESSQIAATGSYWSYPDLTDQIGVCDIYRIPGKGEDVPVLPNQSIVVAISAQNFATENGAGLDLSKADFEYFDGVDAGDTDNPDVPDLEPWVKSSWTLTILHGRGYMSIALANIPSTYTAESFMAEFPWTGKMTFYLFGEPYTTRDILAGNYLIKNDWVVDGINLGVAEDLGKLALNASVDAGYTGCGVKDSDPDRYGKSALRKRENGKLVDTNNSTDDFVRDSTPSLKK
ncbi:MAG: DUF4876 domain-containing protein [Bacteroidales bacterium]|nr:DUF4876 domain-containing protein [Bacteroidales bacterium]